MPKLTAADRKRLLRIRERVEATHWMKGKYYSLYRGKARFCLTGLVNVETGPNPYLSSQEEEGTKARRRLLSKLLGTIQALYGQKWETIEGWNDSTKTKREDVLAVIDKALEGGD